MNYEQLKNSILQEAIEGRLVPQNPSDEPAAVLLRRIREEKARLVKEKKIKKDKNESTIYRNADGHWMERFEDKKRGEVCIDDEIPFEIPETWEWCRLGVVCKLIGGYAFKSHEYTSAGCRVIRISDIGEKSFIDKNIVRYPFDKKLQQYIIMQNDILIAMTGGTVGKSLFVKKLPEKDMLLNQRVAMIRPSTKIDINYMDIIIKSRYIQDIILHSKNSTNDNISMVDIYNFLLPLPPLSEQHRIVSRIEEIMPKVEAYGKAQERLDALNAKLPKDLKNSILQEAIEGHLVPQDPSDEPAAVLLQRIREEKARLVKEKKIKKDKNESIIYRNADGHWMERFEDKKRGEVCIDDEIPFEIPEGWEWCRLINISEHFLGKTLNKSRDKGNPRKYLCSINVYTNGISLDPIKTALFTKDEEEKYALKKGDILVCEGGDVGRSAIWDKDIDMVFQNALHRIRLYGSIIPEYIKDVLDYYKANKTVENVSKGVTIKHFTQNALDSLLFPLPPLSEQHRIVSRVEEIMPKVARL